MNASRKKDREQIAARLIALAEMAGADIERRDTPRNVGYCGATIDLAFRLNGVYAGVSVNDLHGGDKALIHWANCYRDVRHQTMMFSPEFNAAVGSYQPRPHSKATSCWGWKNLERALHAGLAAAMTGAAFSPSVPT